MIAVVVNSLNKAYFLRENDPVFNGFVVKITGDSIIFKETVQDRMGKPSMREVTEEDYNVGGLGRRWDCRGTRRKQIWLERSRGEPRRVQWGERNAKAISDRFTAGAGNFHYRLGADPERGHRRSSTPRWQKVNVVRTSDGFSVEISARGTVKPRLSTLDSPARIVVDLPNTVVAASHGLISVDGDGVKDVRLGMDGQGSSRVVVDLTEACRHELVAGNDNTLVLKLYTKSEVAQVSQPAAVKAPRPRSPSSPNSPLRFSLLQ